MTTNVLGTQKRLYMVKGKEYTIWGGAEKVLRGASREYSLLLAERSWLLRKAPLIAQILSTVT
jgi:hypothetical protein